MLLLFHYIFFDLTSDISGGNPSGRVWGRGGGGDYPFFSKDIDKYHAEIGVQHDIHNVNKTRTQIIKTSTINIKEECKRDKIDSGSLTYAYASTY